MANGRDPLLAWLVSSCTPVLTGQDGFSADQARGFASTPQEFLFGVCATASIDPHFTVHQPVTLQAVTIP